MVWYLITAFTALGMVYFAIAYYQISKKINNLQYNNLLISNLMNTLEDGFYLWDEEKRIEKFSPSLQLLLNTVFYSFDEFADFFEESNLLKSNFLESRNTNKSFTLELKGKDFEIYCCCYGKSIIDQDNKIVGVLICIRNISGYKLQINNLEQTNKKLNQEMQNYVNIFNSLPIPIWKRSQDSNIIIENSFYKKYIRDNKIINHYMYADNLGHGGLLNDKINYVIIDDERKVFRFYEISSEKPNEFIGYGIDITQVENLSSELSTCISVKKDLLNNISTAISIYNNDGKLEFYNAAFYQLWNLPTQWLDNNPNYSEVMYKLFKSGKFISEDNFEELYKHQYEFFSKLLEPYYDFFTLRDGNILKALAIPDTNGRVIFLYEHVN